MVWVIGWRRGLIDARFASGPSGLKFNRNDRIRTTYYYSEVGTIQRYVPIPSREQPGTIMEWYLVRYDDGTQGTMHHRHDEPLQ